MRYRALKQQVPAFGLAERRLKNRHIFGISRAAILTRPWPVKPHSVGAASKAVAGTGAPADPVLAFGGQQGPKVFKVIAKAGRDADQLIG